MNPFRSVLIALSLASFAWLAVATPATAAPVGEPTNSRLSSTESALASKNYGPVESGVTASRRKRPKFMPMYKAKNNARYAAYQIYLDPEFSFDQYGTGKCKRKNRSRVYCYTWASEDVYDDLGYYLDTMLCDWFTTSSYNRRGKMKIRIEQPECVWISEI